MSGPASRARPSTSIGARHARYHPAAEDRRRTRRLPAASARNHRLYAPEVHLTAFAGESLDADTLRWCVDLVKANPDWPLSVQQHKTWGIR